RDQLRQRPTLDVLHDDEGPVVVVDHVEDRRQAGVVEGGPEPRLAEDSPLTAPGTVGTQALDRDPAAEELVLGEEDGCHPARSDSLQDPVAPGYAGPDLGRLGRR